MRATMGAAALLLSGLLAPAAGTSAGAADQAWQVVFMPGASHLSEPSLAVGYDGSVYVAAPALGRPGAGDPGETAADTLVLYRSRDGGRAYSRIDLHDANLGGLDGDVDALPDGTVNAADSEDASSGTGGVYVYHSGDGFTSRAPGTSVGSDEDRPWLGHLCNRLAYLAYRDFATGEIGMYSSPDGGRSWGTVPSLVSSNIGIKAPGGPPNQLDTVADTFPGRVAVDQRSGEIYVTYGVSFLEDNLLPVPYGLSGATYPNAVVVASSTDGGLTFSNSYAFVSPPGTVAGPIFPSLALDQAGTVYVSWAGNAESNERSDVSYAYSSDRGKHWSGPRLVAAGGANILPVVAAGDPGTLDIAWYSAAAGTKVALAPPDAGQPVPRVDWNVEFAQVRGADSAAPSVLRSRVSQRPVHHGTVCVEGSNACAPLTHSNKRVDRTLRDFMSIAIGPTGEAYVAWADNGQLAPDRVPRDNFLDNHLAVAVQSGGPPAFSRKYDVCGRSIGVTPASAALPAVPAGPQHDVRGDLPMTGTAPVPVGFAAVALGMIVVGAAAFAPRLQGLTRAPRRSIFWPLKAGGRFRRRRQ
ncbi:MAG: glycoside hydrolase [Candidatus Dormibacteraeota bacterium]|nr:glycoside hydrolase [Candidatus Dormibacteraeota bacterium]